MSELSIIATVFVGTTVCISGIAYFVVTLFKSESAVVGKRMDVVNHRMQSVMTSDQNLALLKRENDWRKFEFFSDFPPFLDLPRLFEQSGVDKDVGSWLIKNLCIAGFLGISAGFMTKSLMIGLPVFLAAAALPYLSLLWVRKKRIKIFEAHLAQTLEILSRSLKAGHPFSMGLQMIVTEMPSPIRDEFTRVYNELQMGLPIEESLRRLAQRVPLLDMRFFVLAILIHDQVGGDLSEVLDNLSRVIRDRYKVLGQVRALTAEGRLSGWVLSLLPVFVICAIMLMNPEYVMILFRTEIGNKLLYFAGGMQIIGILVIRKVVNIKV